MIWSAHLAPGRATRAACTEQRRHERMPTETVTCALGEVVDISESGMRLSSKRKPPIAVGHEAQFRLLFPKGNLIVAAQARWIRRRGLRRFEIGLQFMNLTPAGRQTMASLAHFGFVPWQEGQQQRRRTKLQATVDLPDYYTVLGLQPGASAEDIKAAYRTLARQYHPDTTTDPDGEAKFKQVQQAYQVLSDVDQRSSYDVPWVG